MKQTKNQLLSAEICHIDITQQNLASPVDAMEGTSFQAKNLARAAKIYNI